MHTASAACMDAAAGGGEDSRCPLLRVVHLVRSTCHAISHLSRHKWITLRGWSSEKQTAERSLAKWFAL